MIPTDPAVWIVAVCAIVLTRFAWVVARSGRRGNAGKNYDRWFRKQPSGDQERIMRRAALLGLPSDAPWRQYVRRYGIDPRYSPEMDDPRELRWLLRYGNDEHKWRAKVAI